MAQWPQRLSVGTNLLHAAVGWDEYNALVRGIFIHGDIFWPQYNYGEPPFEAFGPTERWPKTYQVLGYSIYELEEVIQPETGTMQVRRFARGPYHGRHAIRLNFSPGIGAFVSETFIRRYVLPIPDDGPMLNQPGPNIFAVKWLARLNTPGLPNIPRYLQVPAFRDTVLNIIGLVEIKWRVDTYDFTGTVLPNRGVTLRVQALITSSRLEEPGELPIDLWVGTGSDSTALDWLPDSERDRQLSGEFRFPIPGQPGQATEATTNLSLSKFHPVQEDWQITFQDQIDPNRREDSPPVERYPEIGFA